MKHIPIIRLVKLAANTDTENPQETAHLRTCQHCQIIYQRFVEDFKKQVHGKPEESAGLRSSSL